GAAAEDRLAQLKAANDGTVPAQVETLIADVRLWLDTPVSDNLARANNAQRLIDRCVAMEPAATPDMGWADMMRLSLYA
ncbi:hypothetical protein NL358_28575, partial [Klebsiella pneumoniae]|nr:hypothetical protein [Klebsiella pneumoniae]